MGKGSIFSFPVYLFLWPTSFVVEILAVSPPRILVSETEKKTESEFDRKKISKTNVHDDSVIVFVLLIFCIAVFSSVGLVFLA